MRQCAIIQLEAIHEIVTPGIIYSLNEIGFKPVLYFNNNCSIKRGDIFKFCSNLDFDLVEFTMKGDITWDDVKRSINESDTEFIIINTFQKIDRLKDWYNGFDLPLIGIVHNVNILTESPEIIEIIKDKNIFLFTIASHVNFFLRHKLSFDSTNIDFYIPSYLLDDYTRTREFKSNSTLKLAIAGGVNNLKNRGFVELLNYLRDNRETVDKVKFVICGGGKDRLKLEKFVNQYEIQEFFEFVKIDTESGYVMYNDYFKALIASDYLLTLFPPDDVKYFKFKATASIMTALSIELPIITDFAARNIYNVPCNVYDNKKIETLFAKIKSFTEEKYKIQKERVKKYRLEYLQRSVKSFEIAIDKILEKNQE